MHTVHDPDYRQSWKDWESFVETLTEKISELDETVPELPPKDLVSQCIHSARWAYYFRAGPRARTETRDRDTNRNRYRTNSASLPSRNRSFEYIETSGSLRTLLPTK